MMNKYNDRPIHLTGQKAEAFIKEMQNVTTLPPEEVERIFKSAQPIIEQYIEQLRQSNIIKNDNTKT